MPLDLRTLADEWRDEELEIEDLEAEATIAIAIVTAPAGHPAPRLYRALHGSIIEEEWIERIEAEREDRILPYERLCDELSIDASPDALERFGDSYEPTLIPDDEFEDYAQELAEDIGAIDDDAGWPANHIDWEAAADALRMDYTTIAFKGDDYLIRSW